MKIWIELNDIEYKLHYYILQTKHQIGYYFCLIITLLSMAEEANLNQNVLRPTNNGLILFQSIDRSASWPYRKKTLYALKSYAIPHHAY